MIKEFVQGSSKDKQLFGLVGALALSREANKRLGTAVTSQAGDIWLVSLGEDGCTNGFSLTRLTKGATDAHIRFLYAVDDTKTVLDSILNSTINMLRGRNVLEAHTTDREGEALWLRHGFAKVGKPRGSFCRFWVLLKKSAT